MTKLGRPSKMVFVEGRAYDSVDVAVRMKTGGTVQGFYKALQEDRTYRGFRVSYEQDRSVKRQKRMRLDRGGGPLLNNRDS